MALPPGLPPPPKQQPMRSLHRALGLVGALFLLLLVSTGIALQHPGLFRLDTTFVTSAALLDWYGVSVPPARVFDAGTHRVARIGELTTLDDNPIDLAIDDLIGAIAVAGHVLVVDTEQLTILTGTGELVDRMSIPTQAIAVGTGAADGSVNVRTASGVLRLSEDLADWHPAVDAGEIRWQTALEPNAAERPLLEAAYRGRLITVERFLLDLHSGRFFGRYGPYFIDLAAILVLLLAASGLLLMRRRQ